MTLLSKINLDKVFKTALRNGGELAELFFENSVSHQVFFEAGKLDRVTSGADVGVGLRIIYGEQSVYGYTTEPTEKSLLDLAETMSRVVQGKIANKGTIAFSHRTPGFTHTISKDPSQITLKQRLDYAQRASQAAWKMSKEVKQVTVGYIETLRKIEVVNSFGEMAADSKQYLTLYTEAVGERGGQTQTSFEAEGGYVGLELFDAHPPEDIAAEAVRRLNVLLGAKPAPSGAMPVVLSSEAGGTMVHEAVGHGLEADLACNGMSVYKDRIGQQVANALVTVIDDGTMEGKRGSYAFDDEGTQSKKNVLIENGILKSYMVDRLSHMKFGLPMTGNGRRQTYRHKPIVRMTNTFIAPGKDNPDSILKETPWGLYVKSMGGGQVNTTTGDFVFAVTEGYLIKNGELGPAVRGATLTGNGPEVLSKLDRLGTDLGFAIGTCGKNGQGAPVTDAQPTLRVPELIVGGEVPMTDYWKK